jgi:hypothetical protein
MKRFLTAIEAKPDSWVRLVEASWRAKRRVTLRFGIAGSRSGSVLEEWWVYADSVRECSLSDANGGGLQLSLGSHPALRQYTDPVVALRFQGPVNDGAAAIGDLWRKHVDVVDDWIAADRYLPTPERMKELLARRAGTLCRGPQFLITHYASSLKGRGIKTTVVPNRARRAARKRVGLLHFGSSFVIAERFTSERAG